MNDDMEDIIRLLGDLASAAGSGAHSLILYVWNATLAHLGTATVGHLGIPLGSLVLVGLLALVVAVAAHIVTKGLA